MIVSEVIITCLFLSSRFTVATKKHWILIFTNTFSRLDQVVTETIPAPTVCRRDTALFTYVDGYIVGDWWPRGQKVKALDYSVRSRLRV